MTSNLRTELMIDFFGLRESNWLMGPSERLMVIALLELLKPDNVLEIGHRFGGCTKWLSRYAKSVISVDIDEQVLANCRNYDNVTANHSDSNVALQQFIDDGLKFDLCIIDGDHTRAGAYNDLKLAVDICEVIILHDSSNPICREGYLDYLKSCSCYYDLDVVDGHIQEDGLWGGLGIVLTKVSNTLPYCLTNRKSNFDLLAPYFKYKYPFDLIADKFRKCLP